MDDINSLLNTALAPKTEVDKSATIPSENITVPPQLEKKIDKLPDFNKLPCRVMDNFKRYTGFKIPSKGIASDAGSIILVSNKRPDIIKGMCKLLGAEQQRADKIIKFLQKNNIPIKDFKVVEK